MCYAVQLSMFSFGVRSYPCAATFTGYQVIFVLSRTFLTFLIRESFTAPLLRRKMYINTAPHKKQALFYLFFIFYSVLSGAPNFRNCLSNSIDRNDPDSIDFPAGLFIRARKQDACKTESFRFQNPQLSLADRPDFT